MDINPTDLITINEAREILGVSRPTMAKIVKKYLRYFPNPIDGREKLVSKAEVLALLPRRAEAA
jgi:predicted DNA-binding transcriptional regulator AlpA